MADDLWSELGRPPHKKDRALRRRIKDAVAGAVITFNRRYLIAFLKPPRTARQVPFGWTPIRNRWRQRLARALSGVAKTGQRLLDRCDSAYL